MQQIELQQIQTIRQFHLAGIVPIAGPKLDFNMPWHDCMMPLSQNYLAVERAILECAWAGCETIWVVCNNDIQPLLKNKIGNFVYDPLYTYRKFPIVRNGIKHVEKKRIPIYFVPIEEKHRNIRNSYPFSILQGAYTSFIVSTKMSKWLNPSMFYVAFPYGVYDPKIVKEDRLLISSFKNYTLSYDNKSIKDGEYLAFTFSPQQYKLFRNLIKSKKVLSDLDNKKVQMSYCLKDVFGNEIINEYNVKSIDTYYNIDNWESYRECLSKIDKYTYYYKHIKRYFPDQKFQLLTDEEDDLEDEEA